MNKILTALFAAAFCCGCVSLAGSYSYIPIGPQDLTRTVGDGKKMPVFITREEIKRPWAALGLMRVKNLPYKHDVIRQETERLKAEAAKKGADALIINQYIEENSHNAYPVTLAAYLVKYLDNLSDEDKIKVQEFAAAQIIENEAK
ncbi:MAG: hypothetical protein LBG16_00940 [Elusimicrobiota bacterium]|jgi:uncharacterized small protein (DUF1192 family)|nr:hypothetical protein [Elusimicrobiota bacterium]